MTKKYKKIGIEIPLPFEEKIKYVVVGYTDDGYDCLKFTETLEEALEYVKKISNKLM